MLRIWATVMALLVLSGCGALGTDRLRSDPVHTTPASMSVPGIPQGTPLWLRRHISQTALGMGDPHPSKIVVRLNVREHGRVIDRVWMRGRFSCDSCTTRLGDMSWRGRLIGFTYDLHTHHLLSYSYE
jgi:hypothetical protein